MKLAKYASLFTLSIIIFLMIGELYQGYLNTFSDFYTTTFYTQPNIGRETMLADIHNAAEKNNVLAFTMQSETQNSFTSSIQIYADEKTLNVLKNKYQIYENSFKSLFSGSTDIQSSDFFSVPDDYINGRKPCYYLIGELDNVRTFKEELIDIYGGDFPKQDGYSSLNEKKVIIAAIWFIFVMIMAFQSFYEIERNSKKLMLNLIFGESAGIVYLKNVLIDSIVFTAALMAAKIFLSNFICTDFCSEISYSALGTLLAANGLVYLKVLRVNVRYSLSNAMDSGKLLSINYFLCGVSMLVTSLIIALNFSMITDYIKFERQKTFFEANKNSNYIELRSRDVNIFDVEKKLYYEFASAHKVQYLDPCYRYSNDENQSVHLITGDSKEFLSEWIPEIPFGELDKPAYIIMPEKMVISDEDMGYISDYLSSYLYGTEYYDSPDGIPIITYSNYCEIISVEINYLNRSDWVKNPLIMYINTKDFPEDTPAVHFRTYNLMIEATEWELREYAEGYGCECVVTNVLEFYNHRKTVLSRTLLIASITCAIIIVLNLAIIISTVRLEFQVNAMRHTILKIIGNTLASRLKVLYISLLITDFISALSACFISYFAGIGNIALIIILNIIFVACDALVINIFAQIEDKRQIQRILKGGL